MIPELGRAFTHDRPNGKAASAITPSAEYVHLLLGGTSRSSSASTGLGIHSQRVGDKLWAAQRKVKVKAKAANRQMSIDDHKRSCAKCNSTNLKIIDTRMVSGTDRRRRFQCLSCYHKMTTYEMVVENANRGESIKTQLTELILQRCTTDQLMTELQRRTTNNA